MFPCLFFIQGKERRMNFYLIFKRRGRKKQNKITATSMFIFNEKNHKREKEREREFHIGFSGEKFTE